MRTVHTTCERCGQDRACHPYSGEWVCESCYPLPAELPGTGYRKNGYGSLSIANRDVYTHRLAYELQVGPIPDGFQVCHTCDTPLCVRPDHLFLGTQLDNIDDMRSKGRGANPPRVAGQAHPKATLSDRDIAELPIARCAHDESADLRRSQAAA